MKKLIALLLALVMVLSLVACGAKKEETPKADAPAADAPAADAPAADAPAAEGEVVLTMMNIWCGADSKAAGWTDIVNAFNAEYEGKYEVKLEDQADYDAYVEKMKALISSGDTPDLFTFKADRLNDYCGTGN